VIQADDFLSNLRRAAAGEDPEMLLVEWIANSQEGLD
jgi:hypothetical protein